MENTTMSRMTRLHGSKSHYRTWKSGRSWLYATSTLAALTFTVALPEAVNHFRGWNLVMADTINPSVQINYFAADSQTTAPYAYTWGTGTSADNNFNDMTLAAGTTNQYQTTISNVTTPATVGVILTTTNDWNTAQKLNGDVNGDGKPGDDITVPVASGNSEQINIDSAGLPSGNKSYTELSITPPTVTAPVVNQPINLNATINNPSQLTPTTGLSISVNGSVLTTDPSKFTPTTAGNYTVDYSYGYTSPNEGNVKATDSLTFTVAATNQATLQAPPDKTITLAAGQTTASFTPQALTDSSGNPTTSKVLNNGQAQTQNADGSYSLAAGSYKVQYTGQNTAPATVSQNLTIVKAADTVSSATINVHYYNPAGYDGWNLWKWVDGNGTGAQFSATATIDGNVWDTGTLKYDTSGTDGNAKAPFDTVKLIVRQSVAGNDWAAQTSDLSVTPNLDGTAKDVYIVAGVNKVFSNAADAMVAFGKANVDYVAYDKQWGYDGILGAIYSPIGTTFKVWAPASEESGVTKVQLVDYGKNDSLTASPVTTYDMTQGTVSNPNDHTKNTVGLWSLTLPGDLKNTVYTYKVTYDDGTTAETEDPYSVATIINGRRSVVVDPAETVPAGFTVKQGADATWRVSDPTDAVIQELNVRDFTISPSSGVDAKLRGKFLGVVQTGTKNTAGNPTGLDYLKQLGVNYVEIMPMADFANDETKDEQNWGYNPENYNVPEGMYSTNAADPLARITEMKDMVQGLHNAGIGVIMDVVYPHVADPATSPFQILAPQYYFRNSNGTGMGNDTASEREMYSNYIVNSLVYWATHYNIDGFRFDQMMNIDVNTMNTIRARLSAIDPNIILYGEGWNGSSTALPSNQLSDQNNIKEIPGIGVFNDIARDAIKGSDVYSATNPKTGFVNESSTNNVFKDKELAVADVITGTQSAIEDKAIPALTPSQILNFVEVHDNATLNDLLWKQNPKDTQAEHNQRVNLANAINILSAGASIMETGQEFDRSKVVDANGNGVIDDSEWQAAINSYNAGDAVNGINWDLSTTNASMVKFIEQVIAFKKTNPSFTLPTFNQINQDVKITNDVAGSGLITYEVTQGKQKFLVIYNASGKVVSLGQGLKSLTGINSYATTDFTHAHVEVTDSTGLTTGQTVGKAVMTLSDLSATIVRLAQDYNVTFNTNGGSAIADATVSEGKVVTMPTAPTKSGYNFDGWYLDAALTTSYNFAAPVTSDFTLYAKWTAHSSGPSDSSSSSSSSTGSSSSEASSGSSQASSGSSQASSGSSSESSEASSGSSSESSSASSSTSSSSANSATSSEASSATSSAAPSDSGTLPRTGDNASESLTLEALGLFTLLVPGAAFISAAKRQRNRK